MLKMPQIVREIRIVAIIMTFANTLNAPLVAGSPSKRPCENGRSVCFAYIDMAGEVAVVVIQLRRFNPWNPLYPDPSWTSVI